MPSVEITIDPSGIERIIAAMQAAGARAPDAIARAVNWTGERAETRISRALAKQTGLPQRTTKKALHRNARRATAAAPVYRMRVTGGNISLKYFGARETRRGVSAAPWGKRSVYPGTFMKAGAFPNRVDVGNWHGQVFERVGKGKLPIKKVRSGMFLPEEAVKGESAKVFAEVVATLLPARVEHEVAAILAGFAS